MSQNAKTAVFAAIAVVVLILAFLVRPGTPPVDATYDVGQPLFPDFSDPLAAVSMEVIRFDEDLAAKSEFKVSQVDGLWVIPSHSNYPADAAEQMKNAAALLVGLKKIGIVTGDKAEHETYGVKDPDDVTVGTKGVGTLVRFSDKDGRALAKLIVGKQVADKEGQHYVRVPGFDRVYVSQIDTQNLSTKFTDWIERDLLSASGSDIRRVAIDNYSIDETRRTKVQGDQFVLTVEAAGEQPWKMAGLKEEEELNKTKLDALKSAVDNLKIVDVERKPELLAKNLRGGRELFKDLDNPANQAIFQSLVNKGYFPVPVEVLGKEDVAILSNEGEVVVGLESGVEYALRFGEITGDDATSEAPAPATKDGKAAEPPAKKKGNNRFMYVIARVNDGLITKPQFTPLPAATPAAPAKPADPAAPAAPAEEKKDEKKEEKTDEKNDEKKAETKEGDAAVKPAAPADPATPAVPAVDPEVKRITDENQRKQKEYDDKVAAATKRVAELNARFADWYYVIEDAEFAKIRLSRKDIIQPNTALISKKAGEQFLAENKTKEGVVTTASGLQYKVIKEGTGKTPTATDRVSVAYKGTLIDGTLFDESKPGVPAEFQVDGVIKGWTEALQLMKEGGKLQLFIPSDLGYAEKGQGDKIGPNATLLFDVELLKVN